MAQHALQPGVEPRPSVRCRPIETRDVADVVDLLVECAPDRPAAYWRQALERMAAREPPGGAPRLGYVLDHDGALVGVLLTLHSASPHGEGRRCNLSSWYVKAAYRGLGTLLDRFAMRDKAVTYTNVSPAPHTIPMHQARGFRRYCNGQMLVLPLLSRPRRGQRVHRLASGGDPRIPAGLRDLVRDHLGYGCLCMLCTDGERRHVVVLQPLTLKVSRAVSWLPRLPALQVVYAPPEDEFVPWLGALSRALLLRGQRPCLLLDVSRRLRGVVGRYVEGWKPRLARGPEPMRLNDLTYTEVVLLGP